MGLFKSMKDSMNQPFADRGSIQGQAQEQNRILTVGSPGTAVIKGHTDTGEKAAGNPVWILDLEVTPEGGAAYGVQKREIISSRATDGYAEGTSLACRIDPADAQVIAFGDKPFR